MNSCQTFDDVGSTRQGWVPSRAQVAIFSPDSFGLGHFRRSMLIAERLLDEPAIDGVVVITGSPAADRFTPQAGIDIVTLPTVTKDARGRYCSGEDDTPIAEVLRARGLAAAQTIRDYRPDLLLVDHAPTGLAGELNVLLDELALDRRRPTLVLGMREIIDDVDTVRAEWQRSGAFEAIATRYDHVLVYGDPQVETTAMELGLDGLARGCVEHVGYVARPMPPRRTTDPRRRPQILVTVGGGGDGRLLLDTYASALRQLGSDADFTSVVLTGPMLSDSDRAAVERTLLATGADVEISAFTPSPEPLMAAATGVVAMGGYNTVTELMSLGTPALIVPREFPRREQLLRAQRLGDIGAIDWEVSGHLTARRLQTFVATAQRAAGRHPRVDLGGRDAAARSITALLSERARRRLGGPVGASR
jgi:predicted glycosyltransferase